MCCISTQALLYHFQYIQLEFQEKHCFRFFSFKKKTLSILLSAPDTEDNVRKRKGNLTNSEAHNATPNVVTFAIEEVGNVKTDYSEDGGVQNVVRFSGDTKLMLTGGCDGYLRVWNVSDIKSLHLSPSILLMKFFFFPLCQIR